LRGTDALSTSASPRTLFHHCSLLQLSHTSFAVRVPLPLFHRCSPGPSPAAACASILTTGQVRDIAATPQHPGCNLGRINACHATVTLIVVKLRYQSGGAERRNGSAGIKLLGNLESNGSGAAQATSRGSGVLADGHRSHRRPWSLSSVRERLRISRDAACTRSSYLADACILSGFCRSAGFISSYFRVR
jgi:hypothetical protein